MERRRAQIRLRRTDMPATAHLFLDARHVDDEEA
jgi:hypothetical protein